MRDMTEGKPSTALWKFTLPLVGSMFFQQLYNMADTMIVGRYVGKIALAGVGASYPILMIFMAFAMGLNIGGSVIISQYFGAKNHKQLKTATSTAIISAVAIGLFLTIIGLLFSKYAIRALNTPAEVFNDSYTYLMITVYGLVFMFLYNICTGVFAAMGDSKTPLFFLIISSLSNIALDIYFVKGLNMGVAGAGWATFICQAIASALSFATLLYKMRDLSSEKSKIFDFTMIKRISRVAIPSILQQSFISVGNLMIQGLINSYGAVAMAAFSAGIKLNTFAIMGISTVGNGVSSFTAQNMGAGKQDRVREGYKAAIIMASLFAMPFVIAYVVFPSQVLSVFLPESQADSIDVIKEGTNFLRIVAPFYIVIAFKLIPDGLMRGAGDMRAFMVSTFTDLIARVGLSFLLAHYLGMGVIGIWISWPVGWVIGIAIALYYYYKGRWKTIRLIDQ